jgi:putative ABC transport system permease protein
VLVLNTAGCSSANCRQLVQVTPPTPGCPVPQFQFSDGGSEGQAQAIVGLGLGCSQGVSPTYLVESGPTAQMLIGGKAGRQAGDALAAGEAVMLQPSLLYHGDVLLSMGPGAPSTATIPAVQVSGPQGAANVATIILPPSEAARLDLQSGDEQIYVKRASTLPAHEIKAADDALVALGFQGLDIETGYHDHITGALWAVIGGDTFLVLGAAIAATLLIGIDSRDDLMTFAAVGAAPRSRRRLAVARAGVICLVGALFGTAAGLLPGVELVWRLRHENNLFSPPGVPLSPYPLTIPWIHLAIVVLAAPAVAMLAAAATTRARLPIERRRIG